MFVAWFSGSHCSLRVSIRFRNPLGQVDRQRALVLVGSRGVCRPAVRVVGASGVRVMGHGGHPLEGVDNRLLRNGTPKHYLEEGSRYDIYVTEYCDVVSSLLGVGEYNIGYQNHENRDIPWTEPEVEDLIGDLDAERVVVDPISFLHEQSETLSELDVELAEEAAEAGVEFYRVPIPHDDERIPEVFADLVEPFVADFEPEYYQFRQCQCRDDPGTMCLNAARE